LKHFRFDAKSLAEVVALLSTEHRRTIVKLDDHKIDDPATLTTSQIHAARHVDVSSYWQNPEHPSWGRRHFVYVLADGSGLQYFGDSIAPEVTTVLTALDSYFGQLRSKPKPTVAASPAAAVAGLEDDRRLMAIVVLVAIAIAILAFFIGRWSAPTRTIAVPARDVDISSIK
jgi:hypothetical protein